MENTEQKPETKISKMQTKTTKTKTKTGDFIEIEFVGRIKETNQIFDLTDAQLAKEQGIHNPNFSYGPKVICLGQKHILPALDEALADKEPGRTYKIELKPEQAFGKRDPKLIKIVPTATLKKQNINPFPGLQISASGLLGTIRTVTGGRTTVDFNHPLAGRDLLYEIKINRIVTDTSSKLNALIANELSLTQKDYELKLATEGAAEGKECKIKLKQTVKLPAEIKEKFTQKVASLIPGLNIAFT